MQKDDIVFEDLYKPFTIKKAIFFLIAIGIVVFCNMFVNGFAWDDISYILYNEEIRSTDVVSKLTPNSFNHTTQYRAFTMLYFSVVHAIFSVTPFFYHLLQLLMHLANTMLLFLLFARFFKVLPSFVLVLFFLIHPIQVESVSFIGATGNPLFFLLGLISLHIFLSKKAIQKSWAHILSAVLLLACFLTKETGLAFIMLSLAAVLFFNSKRSIRRTVITISIAFVSYLAIRMGIGGIFFVDHHVRAVTPILHLSLFERIMNIPAVVFYYIKTLVFPYALAIDQIWVIKTFDFQNVYLPLLIDLFVLGLIVFLGVALYRRKTNVRAYIFFLLWFLAGMAVHIQIFPLDMTVADRWFYFPFAGLLGLIGLAWTLVPQKIATSKLVALFICIVLILFSLRTIIRNLDWKDDMTLLKHDTQVITNFELENNLGTYLTYAGEYEEAVKHYKKSVSFLIYDKNLTNMGYTYEQMKEDDNAKEAYQQALSLYDKPHTYTMSLNRAYIRLSGMYLFNKNPQQAETILIEGVTRYPDDGILWSFLAASQYDQKKYTEALASAKKANDVLSIPSTKTLYELIKNKKPVDLQKL